HEYKTDTGFHCGKIGQWKTIYTSYLAESKKNKEVKSSSKLGSKILSEWNEALWTYIWEWEWESCHC
nr:hypothetical protein [Tanacetum cinerariifolium]